MEEVRLQLLSDKLRQVEQARLQDETLVGPKVKDTTTFCLRNVQMADKVLNTIASFCRKDCAASCVVEILAVIDALLRGSTVSNSKDEAAHSEYKKLLEERVAKSSARLADLLAIAQDRGSSKERLVELVSLWEPEVTSETLQSLYLVLYDSPTKNTELPKDVWNGNEDTRNRPVFDADKYEVDPVFPNEAATWNAQLNCLTEHPSSSQLGTGDKILLPLSALSELSLRKIEFPILLQLRNPATNALAYCGVREFSSPEGCCVLPAWQKESIGLQEGQRVHLKTVTLPRGIFARLQPTTESFYKLCVEDPKVILESLLSRFTVLVVGQLCQLTHGAISIAFNVLELQPADAVCILDTELEVDFQPMEGYTPEPLAPSLETGEQKEKGWRQGSGDSFFNQAGGDAKSFVVCDNCGSKVPSERIAMHSAVCYRMNTVCSKCGKKLQKTQLADHMAEAHEEVPCSCGQKVEKYLMTSHKDNDCPLRIVKCEYCQLPTVYHELREHQNYCGSRTELCSLCSQRIMLKNFEHHRLHGCTAMESTDEMDSEDTASGVGESPLRRSVVICPLCYQRFYDVNQLKDHIASSHDN